MKIIKNTKGYNWEIKLIVMPNEFQEEFITRLANLNNQLKEKFKEE